jgi:hypothetical protein
MLAAALAAGILALVVGAGFYVMVCLVLMDSREDER